jgi:hypothetical protein
MLASAGWTAAIKITSREYEQRGRSKLSTAWNSRTRLLREQNKWQQGQASIWQTGMCISDMAIYIHPDDVDGVAVQLAEVASVQMCMS